MSVLVAVAHPDDEVLGCGGTIARHAKHGDDVSILIVAEGATSRRDSNREDVIHLRKCAESAAQVLNVKSPIFLSFPDNRMDSIDQLDVIKEIETHVDQIRPEIVYTHHGGDLNIDHRIVHAAVVTACRPIPGSPVRQIFSFEAASSTEWATSAIGQPFKPVHYVDISEFLSSKLTALKCYQPEMRPFPHARSMEAIEAQARLRGCQVGMAAAEAFQTELDLK